MALSLVRRQFTVHEYHQMAESGILTEDDWVELVDGEIVQMAPIGRRHAACVKRLNRLLGARFGDVALISVQDPVHLDEHTEPQPDVMLLRPRADFYATGHPRPTDVLLLVEVAETSAVLDRRVKLPLYARSGISEVWLVDLDKATIRTYRDPTPGSYRIARTVGRGGGLAPRAFPDRELRVADVLVDQ